MEHLQPGQDIRAHLTKQTAIELVNQLYGFTDASVVQLNGYDDKNYHVQVCEAEKKSSIWPHGYVFKVINSLDSQKSNMIEAQTQMALYLGPRGINCPQPIKNLSGQYYSIEELPQNGKKSTRHIVRMLTYQPGKLLNQVPCSSILLFKIGRFIAQTDQVLKGFHHDAYKTEKNLWSLETVKLLRKFVFAIKDEDGNRRYLISTIIDTFDEEVLTKMDMYEKGLIHGDFNEQNLVVGQNPDDGSWNITALLDLGDTQHSCYLFELAINICYMMLLVTEVDPLDTGGYVIAGYSTVRPLPHIELQAMKMCVSARLCQSLVMGAYSYLQDPGNEYLLSTAHKGWKILDLLWNTPQSELVDRWNRIIASHKV